MGYSIHKTGYSLENKTRPHFVQILTRISEIFSNLIKSSRKYVVDWTFWWSTQGVPFSMVIINRVLPLSTIKFIYKTDILWRFFYYFWPLSRYVNSGLSMRRECRERFPNHQLLQTKPLVSDPGIQKNRDMCVTNVPWCMSRSPTRTAGEYVSGISGACATLNFTYLARGHFWQFLTNGIVTGI